MIDAIAKLNWLFIGALVFCIVFWTSAVFLSGIVVGALVS